MSKKIKGFQDTIDWYDDNAIEYANKGKDLASINLIDKFVELVGKNAKVLDAGCAFGRDTELFKERGLEPVGVDLSKSFLKIAKENNPDIKFVHANFVDLPFKNNTFNGVWAHASLLHLEKIEDVEAALNEFNRVLKKDGILHVFVKQQQGKVKTEVVSDKLSGHDRFFRWFTKDELISLLQDTGFTIEESEENYIDIAGREEVKWIVVFARKK